MWLEVQIGVAVEGRRQYTHTHARTLTHMYSGKYDSENSPSEEMPEIKNAKPHLCTTLNVLAAYNVFIYSHGQLDSSIIRYFYA